MPTYAEYSKFCKENDSSSDESGPTPPKWTNGLSVSQQMYITQQYRHDNGMDDHETVNYIGGDNLAKYKKAYKKQKKSMGF